MMAPNPNSSQGRADDVRAPRRNWPGVVATSLAFGILVSLGVWQLQRLAWKEDLIAQLEARKTAAPISIKELLTRRSNGKDLRYTRVRARGMFLHDQERYFYAPSPDAGPGFNVYTPFEVSNGQGLLIVNRGFVPERLRAQASRSEGLLDGLQDIVGLIRQPETPGWFMPENDTTKNLWFWRDFDAMAAGIKSTRDPQAKPLQLFLDVPAPAPGGWPRGADTKIALSNRHFGYALTWFGLAGALLVIFGLKLRARRRN